MNSIKLRNGKVFDSFDDSTILDSALKQNIILEYSCRTGRCGVCKAKVVKGTTKLLQPEEALSAKERNTGKILTCCRSTDSDLTLEIEDLGILSHYPPKITPCRIDSLRNIASNVMEVVLRLPPTQTINYLPGQYIDVIGKGGVRRSYSIANAPLSNGSITLFIKKVKDGEMSNYWFNDAKVNDLLRLEGPLGTFFFRTPAPKKIVMLATGTGIAPIKAILEHLDSNPCLVRDRRVFLIWGNRIEKDFFWKHACKSFNLAYTPVATQADMHWEGKRGFVQKILIESKIDLMDAAVYACGSQEMIESAKAELVHAGLIPHNFHSDAFVCSSKV